MKLNHDCIRDILLLIESNLDFGEIITDISTFDSLNYSINDKLYSIQKLIEVDYLNGKVTTYIGNNHGISINSITWSGHQFLDNIRDNKVWDKTKSIFSEFTSASISLLSTVASQVIVQMISKNI